MHCYMGGLVVVMVMCRHTWRQLILRKFDRLNMSMDDGVVTWGLTSNTQKLTKVCV
jgi:glutathionyl-hydroquinone reductase